jgi:ectoine hydroxylase-related dioxygenase (phytanoyl-CoA dioxygenase family)
MELKMFELIKFGMDDLVGAREYYRKWGLVVMTNLIPVSDIENLKGAYRDVLREILPSSIDINSCKESNGFDQGFIELVQDNDTFRSRFYDIMRHHVSAYKVGLNPNLIKVVRAFGQQQTILDQLQFRMEFPFDDRFLWHVHQDVLGTKSRNFLSSSTYLTDVSDEMGPVEMSPGSHRLGYLGRHPDRVPDPYKLAQIDPELYEKKYPLVKFFMKAESR